MDRNPEYTESLYEGAMGNFGVVFKEASRDDAQYYKCIGDALATGVAKAIAAGAGAAADAASAAAAHARLTHYIVNRVNDDVTDEGTVAMNKAGYYDVIWARGSSFRGLRVCPEATLQELFQELNRDRIIKTNTEIHTLVVGPDGFETTVRVYARVVGAHGDVVWTHMRNNRPI
jgi:hypothetical protein